MYSSSNMGLEFRRLFRLWHLYSETAVIIIERFPAAQFYTRSFSMFGSYFLSGAKISRIVWPLHDWPIEVTKQVVLWL